MPRSKPTLIALMTSLLLGSAAFACSPGVAEAHQPYTDSGHHVAPVPAQDVSLSLESPHGGTIRTYWYGGSMYAAGQNGERYNIRVQNNTGERVEAVVSVDGRDVVSGALGNYKSQRGYVIEPYGSVVIDGFRQSLDQVAAFRFTDIGNSYSARRGSGQHVGVIGVAVFKEWQPRRQRPREPVPIAQRPYYEPYGGGGYDYRGDASVSATPSAPPPAPAEASAAGAAKSAAPHYQDADDGYHAREESRARSNRLGTEYGESTYSSVREVSFTRKHKRRPDAILTVYYDSLDGLRARGVPVDPPVYSYPTPHPRPFPETDGRHNQYAPPPPARRY